MLSTAIAIFRSTTASRCSSIHFMAAPVLLLAGYFSPVIAGIYSLGLRILFLQMSLMGDSIAQNFLQKAAELRDQESLRRLVEQVFEVLIIVGLYPILLPALVGANVFMVIFGPVWVKLVSMLRSGVVGYLYGLYHLQ